MKTVSCDRKRLRSSVEVIVRKILWNIPITEEILLDGLSFLYQCDDEKGLNCLYHMCEINDHIVMYDFDWWETYVNFIRVCREVILYSDIVTHAGICILYEEVKIKIDGCVSMELLEREYKYRNYPG